MVKDYTNFINTYNEVFDKDNNIKTCGREKTMKLIREANDLEPSVHHGEVMTGFMNTTNIIKLHDRILQEEN